MVSQECEAHAYVNRKPWLRCLLFIMRTCGERTREEVSSPLCRSPSGKRQMAQLGQRPALGPRAAGSVWPFDFSHFVDPWRRRQGWQRQSGHASTSPESAADKRRAADKGAPARTVTNAQSSQRANSEKSDLTAPSYQRKYARCVDSGDPPPEYGILASSLFRPRRLEAPWGSDRRGFFVRLARTASLPYNSPLCRHAGQPAFRVQGGERKHR